MSSINILDYNTIDISSIKFNKPSKGKGGSYMSPCDYNDTPIYIQTPRLISKKGVVRNDSRCTLDLEFDRDHWKFYEFMTNVDDHNVIQIQKNSGEWFDKEFPLDIVEEFYTTPIKIGRGNKPPTLKIKIPIVKGELGCCIYNSNNNVISHSEVKVDSKILCVLKLHGLRYLKQQVICEWVPIQIKVFQKGQDSVYLINDNLLSDIETTEKVKDNNEQYEMITNDDLDNIDLQLEPNSDPVEEPNSDPVEEPNSDPVEEPNSDPVLEPNSDPVEEPNSDPVLEPNSEQVLEPNSEQVLEPNSEQVEESNSEQVLEPNSDLVEESHSEQVLEPNSEQVLEPNCEPVEESHSEQVEESHCEPVLEPNSDFTETTNLNNLEYIKIINEKNLIIEDLKNKFNKLRDFIN